MKTISRILAVVLSVFVVSACGSKFDAKKADAIIEKYKNDATSLTSADFTQAIDLYKAAADEINKADIECAKAKANLNYEKYKEVKSKIGKTNEYAIQLGWIIGYGEREGMLSESDMKKIEEIVAAKNATKEEIRKIKSESKIKFN